MEKLGAREETVRVHCKSGGVRMRRKVGAGVSLTVDYRKDTDAARQGPDRVYLASWEQLQTAKDLIARYCPKAETLWGEK